MSKLNGTSYDCEMILIIDKFKDIYERVDDFIEESKYEAETMEELKQVLKHLKNENEEIKETILKLDELYDEIREKF